MPGFSPVVRLMGSAVLARFAAYLGRRVIVIAVGCWLVQAGDLRADMIVLRDGQTYAGVIERLTSQSAEVFDGNLRRLLKKVGE